MMFSSHDISVQTIDPLFNVHFQFHRERLFNFDWKIQLTDSFLGLKLNQCAQPMVLM